MKEVEAHCERCYDDKDETSKAHGVRIQEQRQRRTILPPGQG